MRPLTLILFVTVSSIACSKPIPAAPPTVAGTNTAVTGTVVERLDGPPYSYLRVSFGGGHERIHLRRSGGSIHGCG